MYRSRNEALLYITLVFVVSVHSVSNFNLFYSNSKTFIELNFKLITKVLDTVQNSLGYLENVNNNLDVDAILGAKVLNDQTKSILRLINTVPSYYSLQKPIINSIKSKLIQTNHRSSKLVNNTIENIFLKDPVYFQAIGDLLSNQIWHKLDCNLKDLDLNRIGEHNYSTLSNIRLNEKLSDFCFGELLNGCKISPFCWKLMLGGGYKDYELAHQVLYLTVARSMNCFKRLSQTQMSFIEDKQQRFCGLIYYENVNIEKRKFPTIDQDIFMENQAFCGFIGFRPFRVNYRWLESIIEWQNKQIGCYQIDMTDLKRSRPQANKYRAKRRETIFGDGCSLHKTSIALASMSIYIQQLAIDLLSHLLDLKCPKMLYY